MTDLPKKARVVIIGGGVIGLELADDGRKVAARVDDDEVAGLAVEHEHAVALGRARGEHGHAGQVFDVLSGREGGRELGRG